jgi:hypothetical protein
VVKSCLTYTFGNKNKIIVTAVASLLHKDSNKTVQGILVQINQPLAVKRMGFATVIQTTNQVVMANLVAVNLLQISQAVQHQNVINQNTVNYGFLNRRN